MKTWKLILIPTFIFATCLNAQQPVIQVRDNLVIEGIPALPSSLIDEVNAYTESRGAGFCSWHPLKKEILITTRFGNSNQIHHLEFPGGARTQLTFFNEPVREALFEPVKGSYFLFLKDIGGNEFAQIYRYDLADKKTTLLTDGKRSQNGGIIWSNKGDRIAFGSTERNGQDRDTYIMDPLDFSSKKRVAENTGGGWFVADWSPDDTKLLLTEYLSINESRLNIVDLNSGAKIQLLPETDERSTFLPVGFSKDNKGVYLITNRNDEFNKLAFYDFSKKNLNVITSAIQWDVENADLSKDRQKIAFVINENGASVLYILSTSDNSFRRAEGIPTGQIGAIEWSGDSKTVGLTINSFSSSSDVYEYDPSLNKVSRWTKSELGGMDISDLQEPQLVTWKSFDGLTISGYLYKASSKFTGKRPVMINIHGGPESQSRPAFLGRLNYYLNELGISIIFPNVRGSSGYGKTFVDLDNGMKREDSVKDIGALLDWIADQPGMDSDRIMVLGGSYGGYMTLAVSFMYSDKIRCSLDVVGISNFNTFLRNTESYRRDLRRAEYGDERDPKMAEFFEAIAPANHTDKIRKPLFIVQGGNDPRVPYTESIQMKENIQKNGGTVWFLMAKDEGHGFAKKDNVDFQFYATIAFVKEFLLN
jgi:dipeptidyl aminopeptidase/acylaminoacyl peptidase